MLNYRPEDIEYGKSQHTIGRGIVKPNLPKRYIIYWARDGNSLENFTPRELRNQGMAI